jgi:hypothetical protein
MRRWLLLPLLPFALLASCSTIAGLDDLEFTAPDAPCKTDGECTDGLPCTNDTCVAGQCVSAPVADGPLPDDKAVDCLRPVCKQGALDHAPDVSDNDDENPCTADSCAADGPQHTALPDGAACTAHGSMGTCVAGSCVAGCSGDATCDDKNACTKDVCDKGNCKHTTLPDGPLDKTLQLAGDCADISCAKGKELRAPNPGDPPAPQGDCVDVGCAFAYPSVVSKAAGTPCAQGVCDGAGNCAACVKASDCTGSDGPCAQRTCVAGACGFTFASAGSVLPVQTIGDCHTDTCDGAGNVMSVVDDLDVPKGPDACQVGTCVQGMPNVQQAPLGTSCGLGSTCNVQGSCACMSNLDCAPGPCATAKCKNQRCVYNPSNAGTALASQTDGDCLEQQCDGQGNVVSVALDTDFPAPDANACTLETCSGGASLHVVDVGATCTPPAGGVCDQSADCVVCNADADCATSACEVPHCKAGACSTDKVPEGAAAPPSHQVQGDCQVLVCDAVGGTLGVPDPNDVPDDNNACTTDGCNGGTPTHDNAPPGTACPGGACNGMGHCQLNNGSACGADGDCQTGHCVDSVCCDTPCNGTCVACNLPGSVGACANTPTFSTEVGCNGNQACNGQGQCELGHGAQCFIAGQCVSHVCQNGACL